MLRRHSKSKFTHREDAMLVESVRIHGISNWSVVASALPGRNPRQCRDRWENYVNPDLTQQEWTDLEDALLLQQIEQIGPHWSRIAAFFPGRSKNHIRIRFHAIQERKPHPQMKEEAIVTPRQIPAPPTVSEKDPMAFLDVVADECPICWRRETGFGDDFL
jgi:hypothetical protein